MTSAEQQTTSQRAVALELGPRFVHVVICEGPASARRLRSVSMEWRQAAATLHSVQGQEELSAALHQLVRQENLQGQSVSVVLDGEFCITRHVKGTKHSVEEALDDLEVRAHRYLLLGQGSKVGARRIQEQDESHCHGHLTVANIKTLHTLKGAAKEAGLEVRSVGASLVMMAELLNRISSGESGGLLVRPREGGADVAVVDEGQLLLDARPPRKMSVTELTGFIGHRFALFERFFGRNALGLSRDLSRIFVVGDEETLQSVTEEFSCRGLRVDSVERHLAALPWDTAASPQIPRLAGAVAAVYGELTDSEPLQYPNLLNALGQSDHGKLSTRLVRTFWPLAAAMLISIGLHLMSVSERNQTIAYADALAQFDDFETKEWNIQDEVDLLREESEHLLQIGSQLTEADYQTTLKLISGCLPGESKLVSVSINEGVLWLNGTTSSEDDVYEFVANLNRMPAFRQAALSGTRTESKSSSPFVEFDVEARIQLQGSVAKRAVAMKEVPRG